MIKTKYEESTFWKVLVSLSLKAFYKHVGGKIRKFNPKWYDLYPNWLEYSEINNAVYCLPCYLFKNDVGGQGGGETFVTRDFNQWDKKYQLQTHIV